MAHAGLAVDEKTLDEEIASSPVPVLVEFTADWCPPCRMMAPVLEGVAAEVGDRLRVLTIDNDDNPDAVRRHQVLGLPTMLVFTEVARQATRRRPQQVPPAPGPVRRPQLTPATGRGDPTRTGDTQRAGRRFPSPVAW